MVPMEQEKSRLLQASVCFVFCHFVLHNQGRKHKIMHWLSLSASCQTVEGALPDAMEEPSIIVHINFLVLSFHRLALNPNYLE